MDRATNPCTPNAGAPPRYLAGRRAEVEDFRTLLRRLGNGYTEQSLVVTGLRGVGKTLLLGEYRRIAAEEGWVAMDTEISKNTPFAPGSRTWPGGLCSLSPPRSGGGNGLRAPQASSRPFP